MNSDIVLYVFIFLISVLISSVSQIILKKSANKPHKNLIHEYFNFPVVLSYSIFLLATFLTVFAYKKVPLSYGPVLESTGYIYVLFLSSMVLKEKITIKKAVGTLLILVGILVYTFF